MHWIIKDGDSSVGFSFPSLSSDLVGWWRFWILRKNPVEQLLFGDIFSTTLGYLWTSNLDSEKRRIVDTWAVKKNLVVLGHSLGYKDWIICIQWESLINQRGIIGWMYWMLLSWWLAQELGRLHSFCRIADSRIGASKAGEFPVSLRVGMMIPTAIPKVLGHIITCRCVG